MSSPQTGQSVGLPEHIGADFDGKLEAGFGPAGRSNLQMDLPVFLSVTGTPEGNNLATTLSEESSFLSVGTCRATNGSRQAQESSEVHIPHDRKSVGVDSGKMCTACGGLVIVGGVLGCRKRE